MNRRKRAIGLATLLVLAALAAWWKLRSGAPADERAAAGAGARTPDRAEAAAGRRIDVATVARAAIAGTVRDPQGAAIAGAQVCAHGRSQQLSDEDLRDPRCARTGGDGRYRVSGLLPARYRVQASAPRFTPASYQGKDRSFELRLAAGQERGEIDIVLRPGGVELLGTVKDIGGGPVEGAWVHVMASAWADVSATAHARSGADGSFRAWVAPGPVHINARADGYADGRQTARAPGRATILLTPESVLAGRVVEAGSGAPVAGARVTGGDQDAPFAAGEDRPDVHASAVTDDDGRFRMARLPPGRYKPTARAERGHGQARRSVLLGLGQTATDVVIEIHPAVQVTGRVLAADRTPCADGRVGLFDPKTERRAGGEVEDGRVAIDAVLPGAYEVSVYCRGFRPEEEYPDLAVASAALPEQTWTVRSGGRIRGTVRWSTGAPAAQVGVNIRLQGEQRTLMEAWQGAQSDADGAFELDGLRPGSYKVGLEGSGPAPDASRVVTVADGGEATVDLVVEEGGGVAGEVVDERGRPVAGVDVHAYATSNMYWSGDSGARTADDGSFAIERLRPGPHRVAARRAAGGYELRAPGKGDDDDAGQKVTVVAGQTARVRLVVVSPSGVIRGRVVDGQGTPITDAFVDAARESESATAAAGQARHAVRWGWSRDPALTDIDGAFTLDELTPGKYTVRAFRRGGGEALAEGVAVGGSATLTIRRTGSVSGTARAPGGAAPETLTVALRDRNTGFARSETFFRTGGQFALRDLPAGSFEVVVRAPEGSGRAEAVLAEGQDLTGVTVTLEASATITGRVVSLADGSPIPGCLIHVQARQDASRGRTFTDKQPMSDKDGRFEVKNAPSGRVEITAFPLDFQESGHFVGRRVVTVESGRANDIGDLRVPRQRLKPGEPRGDVGFELAQTPPDADPEQESLRVALVRPDGPAAASGMRPGDVIVSVDGMDVSGDRMLFWSMITVPPGTALTVGLESGASAHITAGPPR